MPDLFCNLAGRRSEQLWQKKTAWSTEDQLEKQEPVKGPGMAAQQNDSCTCG